MSKGHIGDSEGVNTTQSLRTTLLVDVSTNSVKPNARDYTARIVEQTVPWSEITPHPENPRVHPESQIQGLKASQENLGQFEPVIIWKRPHGYTQVKGHGYGEGAQQAGETTTRAWVLPEDTPESVVKQIMLASNLHGMNSYDDRDALTRLLKEQKDEGADLLSLGSSDDALHELLAAVNREHATDFLDSVLKAPRKERELEEESEEDDDTLPLSSAESPQYFQVVYSLTLEERTTVLSALKKAKEYYGVQTSNQALVQICTQFIHEREIE